MKRIAIIGGGISGLAAAFTLEEQRRAGAPVEYALFESSPRFGGVIATERVENFIVEAGPDSFLTEKLLARREQASREMGIGVPVIFTAHSVPQQTITEGDPYETQAKQTAALVAREAALAPEDSTFAFQSQGMSGAGWLGPTVEEAILALKQKGHRGVFIQPIGFLCDHVEVLYDIDIGFKQFAQKEQMRLWRAESLNDSPLLTAALADVARSRLRKVASPSVVAPASRRHPTP